MISVCGGGAVIVLRARERRVHGEGRQSQELWGYRHGGGIAPAFKGKPVDGTAEKEVSEKTAWEGKPDAAKVACPVWEGALGNQRKRRYTERPRGDSAPPSSCRKTRMAPSFYPHEIEAGSDTLG